MSYVPLSRHDVQRGVEALGALWPHWDQEVISVDHDHQRCQHAFWPGREIVATQVLLSYVDSEVRAEVVAVDALLADDEDLAATVLGKLSPEALHELQRVSLLLYGLARRQVMAPR